MVIANYKCSQQDLYTICRLGWESCTNNLADFTSFSPQYTAPFITAQLAEVDAAEALGDVEQREANSRLLHISMKNDGDTALEAWQRLKRYITKAYPKDQLKVQLDAAGQQHYTKAANYDWSSIKNLMMDGKTFLTDNSAQLEVNGIMPAGFIGDFDDAKDDFDDDYQEYLAAVQEDELETQTKINANNAIHASLMTMFLDGQDIYRKNEALKKQFTFDQVLLTVAGPGNQGYKGNITQTNGAQVPGGTVEFSGPTNKIVDIDENGHYDCPQLAAGPGYTITVTVPGCEVKVIENAEVETGVMKTLNILLTSLPS